MSLCTGGPYAAQLTNAKLTLRNATISGTSYGVKAYAMSVVSLNNCTMSNCTSDGLYLDASTGTLANCTVTSCARGAQGINNSTLNATGSTFNTNTEWAITNTGYGSISDCIINKNGKGLSLIGATTRGDYTIADTKIQGTTGEGLMAVRCTGDVIAGNDKLSKGGAYGVYLLNSDLVLTGVEISSPQYGVQSYDSDLELDTVTISNCQYDGIYMNHTSGKLKSCVISNCRQGVWSENGGTLVADTCTLANHSSWAINHLGFGSVDDCQVNTCARESILAGAAQRGDVSISNTVIQGTTGEGLAAIKCTGSVVAGADKLSKGGSYGIYASDSSLQLPDISISGPQYGIQSFNSTFESVPRATISNCSLDGIYGDHAETTLTSSTITGCRYGFEVKTTAFSSHLKLQSRTVPIGRSITPEPVQ